MSKSTRWISILLFLILLTLIGVYAALRVPYLAANTDLPSAAPLVDASTGSNTTFATSNSRRSSAVTRA